MIEYESEVEREALLGTVAEAYMEIFPSSTIEERLDALPIGCLVAVTCSPAKGVDETLAMTARLADRGFRVVPHIAAKTVRGRGHLREIMSSLADLPVDSIFVPGGDASKPAGEYATALELLRDIADYDHRFSEIGVATHPEGHPDIDDQTLFEALEKKQPYATYLVTQMCFDTEALERWLKSIRERGIHLPAWIGVPGVSDRAALLRTSLRIGVGDSLRFLRRRGDAARKLMRKGTYTPDELFTGMARMLADPDYRIDGCHIYCFNQVEVTERWRVAAIEDLQPPGAG